MDSLLTTAITYFGSNQTYTIDSKRRPHMQRIISVNIAIKDG